MGGALAALQPLVALGRQTLNEEVSIQADPKRLRLLRQPYQQRFAATPTIGNDHGRQAVPWEVGEGVV